MLEASRASLKQTNLRLEQRAVTVLYHLGHLVDHRGGKGVDYLDIERAVDHQRISRDISSSIDALQRELVAGQRPSTEQLESIDASLFQQRQMVLEEDYSTPLDLNDIDGWGLPAPASNIWDWCIEMEERQLQLFLEIVRNVAIQNKIMALEY